MKHKPTTVQCKGTKCGQAMGAFGGERANRRRISDWKRSSNQANAIAKARRESALGV